MSKTDQTRAPGGRCARAGFAVLLAAALLVPAAVTEAAGQSVAQERQRRTLEDARRSVDRATRETERSLLRSQRDMVDRTLRQADRRQLRYESRPITPPTYSSPGRD